MNADKKDLPQKTVGGMHNAPHLLAAVIGFIDGTSIMSGRILGWLIFPMSFSLVFEVASRYLLNAPTIWAGDVTNMLYGAFFMLGSAYALQRQQHIRTDFLYGKWSIRTRGIVDVILYVGLYFPAFGFFLWVSIDFAHRSFMFGERIVTSPWMPIIWPLKMAIPVAIGLLLLQGVSELLKSLYAAVSGISLYEEQEGADV